MPLGSQRWWYAPWNAPLPSSRRSSSLLSSILQSHRGISSRDWQPQRSCVWYSDFIRLSLMCVHRKAVLILSGPCRATGERCWTARCAFDRPHRRLASALADTSRQRSATFYDRCDNTSFEKKMDARKLAELTAVQDRIEAYKSSWRRSLDGMRQLCNVRSRCKLSVCCAKRKSIWRTMQEPST